MSRSLKKSAFDVHPNYLIAGFSYAFGVSRLVEIAFDASRYNISIDIALLAHPDYLILVMTYPDCCIALLMHPDCLIARLTHPYYLIPLLTYPERR